MSSLAGKQGPRYKHLAGESEAYETIAVEKLTPIIGAEISGVDIGKLVSDDERSNRQMDEIHRALAENLVIFFRDQHITPAQHLAFGRRFGELYIHPAAPHDGDDPALMKIHADKDSPRANGEGWHSDVSCDIEPPMGSILYIRQCPPHGGDTLFASMHAAYEALSDRMRAYLDGLTALHDGEPIYRGLYANYGVADKPSYPHAEHPVLRTHPVTGRKALYVKWLHPPHRWHSPRRERRHLGLSLSACGEPAVSVPLPLDGKRHRILGQSLHPAPCDVGLLAAYPLRQPRHGEGRAAGVNATIALTLRLACAKLAQRQKQHRGGSPCSARRTTDS
jgi:taurine dioxygenase